MLAWFGASPIEISFVVALVALVLLAPLAPKLGEKVASLFD